MKKILAILCATLCLATCSACSDCSASSESETKAEAIKEWNILDSYNVNVNANNDVPAVVATTENGKKIAASAEIYDENGESVQIINGTFYVSAEIGKTYRAVYYVLQDDKKDERETTFKVADTSAPTFVADKTDFSVGVGAYVNIDDYFTIKDNTSVTQVKYECKFNGETISYDSKIGLLAEAGKYEFSVTAADGYGNESSQTFSVNVGSVLYQFDSKTKASEAVAHVLGAKTSYPWYFHYANVFSYVETADLDEAVLNGLREESQGALYYDFSHENSFCIRAEEKFDYRDYCGVMIPISSIPDYVTTIKVRVYLVKNDDAAASEEVETASEAGEGEEVKESYNYYISPTESSYLFKAEIPVNQWTTVEIPTSAIFDTRYAHGDVTSFYSIGYFKKTDIDAFYIDDIEIGTYALDEKAVIVGNKEYDEGEIDLTDFIVLKDTEFSYEVFKNGESVAIVGNKFTAIGAGTYTVEATAISGKYAGYTRTETIKVGGYAIAVNFNKDSYERGDFVVVKNNVTLYGETVKKEVAVKVYYGSELVSENPFFTADRNGYYRVVSQMQDGEKIYKSEANVFVGKFAINYNSYCENETMIERYYGNLDWNGGYRSQIKIIEAAETRDMLPSEMLDKLDSEGGALHIIRNGWLRYADGTTPQYFAWEWHDPEESEFKQGHTLCLKSSVLNGNTDYAVLMVKVYVTAKDGETIKWTIYDQNDYGGKQTVKYLEEGWNTLYITAENVNLMLGTDWDRLPLGHFDGVKDMWISYIAGLSEKESRYTLDVVNTVSGTTEQVTFRKGEKTVEIAQDGYTFVGYTLAENGDEFIDTDALKDGTTVYANFFKGIIINGLNQQQNVAVDTFNYNYNWNAVERISTNTNVMFETKNQISQEIASGMYRGSNGMLHVIQDTNVGTTADADHGEGRSVWLRSGFVDLPENYTSVIIRVYVEVEEGKTGKHFFFENSVGYDTSSYVNSRYNEQELTTGWYTLEISKLWVGLQNTGVTDYFGLGHFDNVKNLYVDYVGYTK